MFCGMCGGPLPGKKDLPSVTAAVEIPGPSPEKSAPPEQDTPPIIEGERRIATVILADVRRSTDLLELIGTEAWVSIMNRIFQMMNAEIYRFGGQVDQFRGDGLIAFFGTTLAHGDDPERAVLSALAMQQAINQYAANLAAEKGIDIKLRVGINTGEVIVASVGSINEHQEFTAMGEAVTLAARLEAAAEPGTVLVSENTYHLAKDRFHWQPLGELPIKGFSKPELVFRPLSPRFDFEGVLDLQAYGMPVSLTGREVEFKTIKNAIEGLYKGRGGIVLVSGEKGLGKSLLVTQLRQYFNRQERLQSEHPEETGFETLIASEAIRTDITWLRGSCRSYHQSWPFFMWTDLIYQWLGIRPDESAEARITHLKAKLHLLWGDTQDRYYPYLAQFLSIPLNEEEAEKVRYLDAEGLQKQFYLTIKSWVETLARLSPLVLTFSDVQWADCASIDLLEYCLPVCEKHRVIWMVIYRPDRASPAWEFQHLIETEYPHRLTLVDLRPLNESECHELITQMIGKCTLSEKTEQLIISKSEGNPYFIREMISSLISQGVLTKDPETNTWYEARTITNLDLPDSLQNLLLERLDRLSVEERRVLQAASVMGLTFWQDILSYLFNENNRLETNLTSLQRKGLIQENIRVPGLGMEYSFVSSLVRDVVYDSLLEQQRMAHHHRIAKFLEESTNLENWLLHSSLIAYHYRNAGNQRQELFYTMKAAEQARNVYANTEAIEHYNRAFEILESLEKEPNSRHLTNVILTQKFEILSERNWVNFQLGNFTKALQDARSLLALADELADDPYWRIDALLKQPEVIAPENKGMVESGLPMVREAIELSRQLGDRNRELHSLIHMTNLQFLIRDMEWKSNAEKALKLAREINDIPSQVNLLLSIGSAYGLDDLETSMRYLEMAIPLCQELADKSIDMRLLRSFAEQYERSGDYYRQLVEFEQKRLQISREIGNRIAEADALMYCGQVQGLYLGDLENGLAMLKDSLKIWENMPGSLFPLLRIAQIQIELGLYNEAQETLDQAAPLVERNILDLGRAGYLLVTSILKNHLVGNLSLHEVLDLHEKIQKMVNDEIVSRQYLMASASEVSASYLRLAILSSDENDRRDYRERALTASQLSIDIFHQFGFVQIIECSSEALLYRHCQTLKANGFQEEAVEYLDKAYNEMMRKHDLIPAYSPFRKTYLHRFKLHQQIREDYFLKNTEELTKTTVVE
jgi:class 3 adenylate cyclase/tetratricopeptide (TPR) repeat protein